MPITFWTALLLRFSAVRALAQRAERAEADRAQLQAQIHSLRGEVDFLQGQAEEALANERRISQSHLNVMFQRTYGIRIFPDAPAIPEMTQEPAGEVTNHNNGPRWVNGHDEARRQQQEAREAAYSARMAEWSAMKDQAPEPQPQQNAA